MLLTSEVDTANEFSPWVVIEPPLRDIWAPETAVTADELLPAVSIDQP